eukprot:6206270-Pleurochrysis_carterae.AAC.3
MTLSLHDGTAFPQMKLSALCAKALACLWHTAPVANSPSKPAAAEDMRRLSAGSGQVHRGPLILKNA